MFIFYGGLTVLHRIEFLWGNILGNVILFVLAMQTCNIRKHEMGPAKFGKAYTPVLVDSSGCMIITLHCG